MHMLRESLNTILTATSRGKKWTMPHPRLGGAPHRPQGKVSEVGLEAVHHLMQWILGGCSPSEALSPIGFVGRHRLVDTVLLQ